MAGLWCKDVWMKDSISMDKKLLGTGGDSKNHQVQKWCWNLPMHKLASVFWCEGRSACQELRDLWGHRLASALDFRNLCISENMQMVTWLQCYWAGWIYIEVEIQLWTASLIFVSWSKVERLLSSNCPASYKMWGGVLGPVHILNSKCSSCFGKDGEVESWITFLVCKARSRRLHLFQASWVLACPHSSLCHLLTAAILVFQTSLTKWPSRDQWTGEMVGT